MGSLKDKEGENKVSPWDTITLETLKKRKPHQTTMLPGIFQINIKGIQFPIKKNYYNLIIQLQCNNKILLSTDCQPKHAFIYLFNAHMANGTFWHATVNHRICTSLIKVVDQLIQFDWYAFLSNTQWTVTKPTREGKCKFWQIQRFRFYCCGLINQFNKITKQY